MPTLYTMQHACFLCRKVWKQHRIHDGPVSCPDCGQTMHAMGRAFRAPKHNDVAQWRKAQRLVDAGVVFHFNDGPRPARLQDVPAFLAARQRKSTGQVLLERFAASQPRPRKTTPVQRLTVHNTPGEAPRYTLAGRDLYHNNRVLIRLGNTWQEGTFGCTGWGLKPTQPHVQFSSNRTVMVKASTALRWP